MLLVYKLLGREIKSVSMRNSEWIEEWKLVTYRIGWLNKERTFKLRCN